RVKAVPQLPSVPTCLSSPQTHHASSPQLTDAVLCIMSSLVHRSPGPLRVNALPCQGMLDHGFEPVKTRAPTKRLPNACRIRNQHRRITGTPGSNLDGKGPLRYATRRIDDLANRRTLSIPAVEGYRGSSAGEVAERIG